MFGLFMGNGTMASSIDGEIPLLYLDSTHSIASYPGSNGTNKSGGVNLPASTETIPYVFGLQPTAYNCFVSLWGFFFASSGMDFNIGATSGTGLVYARKLKPVSGSMPSSGFGLGLVDANSNLIFDSSKIYLHILARFSIVLGTTQDFNFPATPNGSMPVIIFGGTILNYSGTSNDLIGFINSTTVRVLHTAGQVNNTPMPISMVGSTASFSVGYLD